VRSFLGVPGALGRASLILGEEIMEQIEKLVEEVFTRLMTGFEERLASAMQKALDTVVSEQNARIRAIEEDLAKIQRHMGLE